MESKKNKKDQGAEAILSSLAEAVEAVKELEAKIDFILTSKVTSETSGTKPSNPPVVDEAAARTVTPEAAQTTSPYPFPLEWREVIDSILNKAFKADVNYRGDGHFELTIFVPREYSNAKPSHWELVHEDRRFTVLQNALGTTGVRDYVEKIAINLGLDIMKKVGDDRLKLING